MEKDQKTSTGESSSHPVWGMANDEVEIHIDVNRQCCRSCRTRAFAKLKSTSMDSRRVACCIECKLH